MKRLLIIVPLVAVAACFLFWPKTPTHEGEGKGAISAEKPAVTVSTFHPGSPLSGPGQVLPGRMKAAQEISVTSLLAARLTALPHREGESFRAGDALAVFDSPETRQGLESAHASARAAQADLDQARSQAARIDSLMRTGVVAERQQELAIRDREVAEATWRSAEATLAQWKLGTRLSMPFDGQVVRRHVDPGTLLQPGMPILDVRSDAVGEIEVAIPESLIPRLAGARPEVQFGESAWLPTELLRVDGMIDYRTRTRTAHLAPVTLAGLEAGAHVRVRIGTGAGGGSPVIPAASLVTRGSLTGVYVVADGRAWLRWLRTGRADSAGAEILAGLDSRDEVVVDPRGLVDGAPVRVVR